MLATLFGSARPSLPSVVVAGVAVGLAWLWLEVDEILAASVAFVPILVGLGAFAVGRRDLRRSRPRPKNAVTLFNWAVLTPGGLAAAVGAALIVVGIDLAPADSASAETKALLGATATAITTYGTTVFIKGAEEADEGWVGKLVKGEFQSAFEGKFSEGSDARDAVYSDYRYDGWGDAARKARAQVIDAAL